jgi:chromosome segregation ATPase
MFETMSMRAIRTLSMTEGDEQVEIVAKLVDQYDGTKKAPTAADIEELREELAQARDRVRGQDTALMQMTSQLAANDAAVSELRESNQLLESANERLKNVATREPVTVETVQPDAERSMRELRKLQKQIEEASASLAAINSQLISNEEQLANLRSRKESEQTIDDLRSRP